jgi:hypothetical protein
MTSSLTACKSFAEESSTLIVNTEDETSQVTMSLIKSEGLDIRVFEAVLTADGTDETENNLFLFCFRYYQSFFSARI